MRRAATWVGAVTGGLLLVLAVVLAVAVAGSATRPGRAAIERVVPPLSGGMVRVTGLSGWLFGASRIGRLELRDTQGTWLAADGLTLAWSPLQLLRGEVMVQRIAADRVTVARRPVASGSGGTTGLPIRIDIAALRIDRLDLAVPVVGQPAGPPVSAPASPAVAAPASPSVAAPASPSVAAPASPVASVPVSPSVVAPASPPVSPPIAPAASSAAPLAASLAVGGAMRLDTADRGSVRLAVRRLDGQGAYTLDARLDPAGVHASLHLAEPAGGLVGSLAALPAIGAITADATLSGPLRAIATDVRLSAGQLRARVTGQIDATDRTADLAVAADAPAMAPRPDLAWHGISLHLNVHGPFARPDVRATLTADGLTLGAGGIGRVTADLQGDSGRLTLDGVLDAIRLPGARPDALAAAPLLVTAVVRLDTPDRPLTFRLRHPLFTVDGTASTADDQQAELHLAVPEIAPLAAAAGIDAAGHVALTVHAARRGGDTRIAAQGEIGVSSGPGPAATLLGQDTRLDMAATVHARTVRLTRLSIDSGALSAGMTGTLGPDALDLDWRVAVADLAALSPTVTGKFSATGKASGSPDNLAVTANLAGEVGAAGIAPGKVNAQVTLAGLPDAPSGHIAAHGMLLGAPLELTITAARENGPRESGPSESEPPKNGPMGVTPVRVTIERADWKSAHAEGTLLVDPAVPRPRGKISFTMTRLDDLQPLLGRSLRGSLGGTLDSTDAGANLTVTAAEAGLPGTATVARTSLEAHLADPLVRPTLDAALTLDGIAARGIGGSARIEAKGPLDALALRVAATLPALAGAPARIDATGTLDAAARTATLATLAADWKQAPIRLLAPARIGFADGLVLDGLRVGLHQAVLEGTGRVFPTLALTARLRDVPASLAALADPALRLDGTLDAEASLSGTPARPGGTLRVAARGLRSATGPAHALPAADLTATAALQGAAARLDLRAKAGATQVTVTGTAPLALGGALDLHVAGAADLAMTDPLLTPGGRRARGRVSLDATVTGTPAAPRVTGTAQLAGGSFRDFAQGIDIGSISATLAADRGALRLTHFAATAGTGTIEAGGSLDLTAPDQPLDLTLTAHNARPLASDLLTADLDADLTLRGTLAGSLTAAGRVFVRHADIRVPDRLPASVPVLNVRLAGAPPPRAAPPPAGPAVALALTIDAPEQLFVRGRGVNAELGGTVHLRGTAAHPVPSDGFTLRRGDFSIAGQTLTFSAGQVSFDSGSLTDPSLNFTATTTAGDVTATLAITGAASNPKITLSSVPSLPQDEILAYLLYGRRTASLGPLEIAQIAATLASLAGAGPTLSDPLEGLRTKLGLDRLSIGSGSTLEAGRYVARNVYVGAKQNVTGTGTQAVVGVDITRRLKLEATAGSSTNPSATGTGGSADAASVGIKYQFEY